MKIGVVTLFPELLEQFFATGILGRAVREKKVEFELVNPRDFAPPPHHHVDDSPYGGGAGMVMKPEPLCEAIESLEAKLGESEKFILSPAGPVFCQASAVDFSKYSSVIFTCGRYEGIDERVAEITNSKLISIGDFVMMGGEVAAMSIIEASTRLIPSVLGNQESLSVESHNTAGVVEAPQYTRPAEFRGLKVPEELLSGNHELVAQWREKQALRRSRTRSSANSMDFDCA